MDIKVPSYLAEGTHGEICDLFPLHTIQSQLFKHSNIHSENLLNQDLKKTHGLIILPIANPFPISRFFF